MAEHGHEMLAENRINSGVQRVLELLSNSLWPFCETIWLR